MILLSFIVLAFLLLSFLVVLAARPASREAALIPPKPIKLFVDEDVKAELIPFLQPFLSTHPGLEMVGAADDPDMILTGHHLPGWGDSREIHRIPALTLKVADRTRTWGSDRQYLLYSRTGSYEGKELEDYLSQCLRAKYPEITMNFAGDIIPSRKVARQMASHGVLFPFRDIAPFINEADVICGDLECPLSDRFPPPYTGVSFIAPTRVIEGLKLCGFNVLNLANNHSTNYGRGAFLDTLDILEKEKIRYFGGGRNDADAYSPLILDIKGLRVAFLGYNCIYGSTNATSECPGVAWFDLPPYAILEDHDLRALRERITESKRNADFLVVCFHWSEEYKSQPSSDMVRVAHAACDAGADLVIGSHPHCVQSLEYYGNSFIFYSLGNFVFDQMFADYTREGFVLKCRLAGDQLVNAELIPYRIQDYCRPVPMDASSASRFAEKLFVLSGYGP